MDDRRVLFFGDSFVNGFGDPEGLGWVGRVTAAAAAAGTPITAYNLGIRGETSEEILARWRSESGRRIDPTVAFGIVFSFGTNDAAQGLPPERSLAALGSALEEADAMRLPALVVGPGPLGDERDERIGELSDRFAGECAARSVRFIPIARELRDHPAWREEAAAGDGTHPGAEGYAELARLVVAGGWATWLAGLG